MNRFLEEAMAMKDEIVANRRHIHRRPELGFDLDETIEFVATSLESYGYQPVKLGGGLTCTAGNGGPVILLRADMDALPMTEDSGESFASEKPGMAHTCGHDAHTAMLLGAAKILKAHEDELHGTVKFMFQPAEELLKGSQSMIDAGILNEPKVDAAMGFHINTGKVGPYDVHPGTMVYARGRMMASADEFHIHIHGLSAHGSIAYQGVNAVSIAANIITALQQLPIQASAYNDNVILVIGAVNGGVAANIVPDEATIVGSMRTFEAECRARMKKRIAEVSETIASAWGGTAEVEYVVGVAPNYNNIELADEMASYAEDIMERVEIIDPVSASEDFANLGAYVPTFFANICMGDPSDGYEFAMHNPKMRLDEAGLPYGTAAHCHLAAEWLKHHRVE